MDILVKAGQLILSLSILVILHEFGHYFFARLFKTRVEKFYLFFDPWFSLFKFKKGDTEYGVGWIPLGGYVKISGMIDESMDKEQMQQPAQPWEFRSKTAWQRLLIMVGGVTVNFLAAIAIYWMLLYQYGETYVPVSGAKNGLYYHEMMKDLGIQDGDLITRADTFEIETIQDITAHLILDQASSLTVKRGDSIFTVSVPENFHKKVIGAEVRTLANFRVPFVVDSVRPDMGAEKAGIKKGDKIIRIDGKDTPWFHEFAAEVSKKPNQNVSVTLIRDTTEMTLSCMVSKDGVIGIYNGLGQGLFEYRTVQYGFLEALPAGISKGIKKLSDYVKQLPLIFSKEGAKQIGGFGTIGSLFPSTWDWQSFWELTAFLSVMLAFMNILPIPALDGGHVMFLLYEIITRRKPSNRFLEYAQVVGMVILLGLLLYANGNDIFRYLISK
ncbi:MAG: RIP metalloprotease RseP [Breznakibacter sp.]